MPIDQLSRNDLIAKLRQCFVRMDGARNRLNADLRLTETQRDGACFARRLAAERAVLDEIESTYQELAAIGAVPALSAPLATPLAA